MSIVVIIVITKEITANLMCDKKRVTIVIRIAIIWIIMVIMIMIIMLRRA